MNGPIPGNGTDEPWSSGQFAIGPEHPALAGHFPGNPIVPGVMVLQHVLDLLASSGPERMTGSVVEAKFLKSLRPAETCTMAIWRAGDRKLVFDCRTQQGQVARGVLILDAEA